MKPMSLSAFFAFLFAVAMTLAAPAANATTISECQAQLDVLAFQVQGAELTGKNAEMDRAGLAGKVSDAKLKLSQGKLADALYKLDDFIAKLNQLLTTGKIIRPSFDELYQGATAAKTCIGSLG